MNKDQQAVYNSGLRIQDFNSQNSDALEDIEDYAPYKVTFDDIMSNITNSSYKQAVDTTVAAPDKHSLKLIMGNVVIKFAQRCSAKAHLLNNTELELGLDKSVTYIIKVNDVLSASRASEMKKLMNDNLTILTCITAADILEMEAAILSFNTIKPLPLEMIKTKKSTGTDPMIGWILALEECKKQMTKLIHSYLPALAALWDEFAKVGTVPGTRKLSIILLYTDTVTGAKLRNVKTTFTSTTETLIKKSTKIGSVRGLGMVEGNWSITSELVGYDTDVKNNVGIKDGVILKYDVKMVKKVIS